MARFSWTALPGALALPLILTGCASYTPDGGFARVEKLTTQHSGVKPRQLRSPADEQQAAARVAELLAQPLGADAAAEIALINNRGLQASFATLGIAEADRVAAGRWRGPTLGLGRLTGGGVVEIDRSIVFDLLQLLTLPAAQRTEQARFEQAQLQAAQEAVVVAARARRAWFRAVAAQELQRYALQVKDAADAATELAARMARAGNFSALQQMREQAFHADATTQLARARHNVVVAREALLRVLGLTAEMGVALPDRLPERLPDLPAALLPQPAAEQAAITQRLDVQIAQRELQARAQALGLAGDTRWLDGASVGLQNQSTSAEPTRRGATLDLSLPLTAALPGDPPRLARARAAQAQAAHHAAAVANDARSQVREAWSAYRAAYEIAKFQRDEVVPLRQRIAQENLLRYNGMLISTFELLADAREQVGSVSTAIEAQLDHWLALVELQAAVAGVVVKEP